MMPMNTFGSYIGSLFNYDPGLKQVEAKALNARMAEAIGSAKAVPGYAAAKTVRELDIAAEERARERIGEIARAIEGKVDPGVRALGLVGSTSNVIGVAEGIYLKEQQELGISAEPLTMTGMDYFDTTALLDRIEPGRHDAMNRAYGPLQRTKDFLMGALAWQSPYGAQLMNKSLDGWESHKGLSTVGKVGVAAAFALGGAAVLYVGLGYNSPEERFVREEKESGFFEEDARRLYKMIVDSVDNDPQVEISKQDIVDATLGKIVALGSGGKTLVDSPAARHFLGNSTIYELQNNITPLDSAKVHAFVSAAVQNTDLDMDRVVLNIGGEEYDIGSKDFARDYYTMALNYSDVPEIITKYHSPEFFKDLTVQQNRVFYDLLKQNEFDPEIRDDMRKNMKYICEFLPQQEITANGAAVEFPLIKLLDSHAMKVNVPARADRAIRHYAQFPAAMCQFDGITGETCDPNDTAKGLAILRDNMKLITEGDKFGDAQYNTLFERIAAPYVDRSLQSYPQYTQTDYEGAMHGYYEAIPSMTEIPTHDFDNTFKHFNTCDPWFKDPAIDLGHRFLYGLSLVDVFAHAGDRHAQHRVMLNPIYAKALGYALYEVDAPYKDGSGYHEETAFPVDKKLVDKMKSEPFYGNPLILPGQFVSPYLSIDKMKADGISHVLVCLPTGQNIEIPIQ